VLPTVPPLRHWIREGVIVLMMLVLLVVEIGLWLTPGKHTLDDIVLTGLIFCLTALWVRVNRTELAIWEQADPAERSTPCKRASNGR